MRVLITGGSGFIGRHLLNMEHGAANWDLKDGRNVLDLTGDEGFTHIFHCAASKSVPLGEVEYRYFIENNCVMAAHLAKRFPKARIVNLSSSSVNEVKSIYGMTKAFAEMMEAQHHNWVNVRLYNVFGEGQLWESGAVIPRFITAYLRNMTPEVYGNGDQKRDFTYVGDVVANLHDIMFLSDATGVIHLGYGEPISVNHLIELIWLNFPRTKYLPKRDCDIVNSCSPNSMPRVIYGREEGLKRTVDWMRHETPHS